MKQIILIDDDPAILDALHIALENAGYTVIIYNDGVKILNNDFNEPDLFIIDKQLSGVDGLDICRFLKNRPSQHQTPVIVISASPQAAKLAAENGADHFIEKPFKKLELLQVVQKFI